MGEKQVSTETDEGRFRNFTRSVLSDLKALEMMLDARMFEENVLRIGAEQELFLVDESMHPAPMVLDVLERRNDERLTTEIGRFNIEANIKPLDLSGGCFTS